MFSPLRNSGHSNNPPRVGSFHSEKNIVVATETVDVGLDPDFASDINPGELTFEEGQSLQQPRQEIRLTCVSDTAGGMGRHMGVFSCTMLKYVLTPLHCDRLSPLFLFSIFSRYDQRWRHHRHRNIRHSVVYPRVSRVRRCIHDALGPWLRVLTLRAICLA